MLESAMRPPSEGAHIHQAASFHSAPKHFLTCSVSPYLTRISARNFYKIGVNWDKSSQVRTFYS